jgi:transposase
MRTAEIADHLLKVHGERCVPSMVWRFFDRRNITFKKRRTPASRIAQTWPRGMEGILSLRSASIV